MFIPGYNWGNYGGKFYQYPHKPLFADLFWKMELFSDMNKGYIAYEFDWLVVVPVLLIISCISFFFIFKSKN